jgi:transposase-like protein
VKQGDRKRIAGQEGNGLRQLLQRGLHALALVAGVRALQMLLEEDREELCGPRYEHDAGREATRFGHARGEVVLGGRRVSAKRPRVRSQGRELRLPSWELATREDLLTGRAFEQMVLGVSTRRYGRSLEPVPEEIESRGESKSAVSRRFVRHGEKMLGERLAARLDGLELAALLIDGLHFGEHVVLCALGIDLTGKKRVLGLWEGATENASACKALLDNMVERGLRTDRTMLVIIDGAKALARAVRDHFGDRALIQRCQVHKRRNVLEALPERLRASVGAAISEAYQSGDAERAKRMLLNLARRLQREHPGAAASLREGLDETLTVARLGLPYRLARSLSTTNAIENMLGRVRVVSRNVKRWRGGTMILRWVAAGMSEAERGFRRLKGHASMPILVAKLREHDAKIDKLDRPKEAA